MRLPQIVPILIVLSCQIPIGPIPIALNYPILISLNWPIPIALNSLDSNCPTPIASNCPRFQLPRIAPIPIVLNSSDYDRSKSDCPDSDLPWIWLPQITLIRIAFIPRTPRQPPAILSSTPQLVRVPLWPQRGLVMAGCWQINSILTNIGRRNSIRILN